MFDGQRYPLSDVSSSILENTRNSSSRGWICYIRCWRKVASKGNIFSASSPRWKKMLLFLHFGLIQSEKGNIFLASEFKSKKILPLDATFRQHLLVDHIEKLRWSSILYHWPLNWLIRHGLFPMQSRWKQSNNITITLLESALPFYICNRQKLSLRQHQIFKNEMDKFDGVILLLGGSTCVRTVDFTSSTKERP